jgi:hypothetical protein
MILAQEPEYMKPDLTASQDLEGKYFINAGIGYNKLFLDSGVIDPMGSPYLGISLRHDLISSFVFEIGGQWARRGADQGYLRYEFRNDYFDFQGTAGLRLGQGFYLNVGFQHSLLVNSFVRVYTDPATLEYVKRPTSLFNHQNLLTLGTDIQLTEVVEFSLLYTYPLENNQFSNIQFGVKVNMSSLKPKNSGRKYTNLNEATRNPLDVGILVLHRDQLKEFPMEILGMSNLEKLILDGNKLRSIPPEIAQLTNLKYLSVQYNEISILPPEIGLLSNLEELDLSYNQLRELPDQIGNLEHLRFLYIGKNSLTSLPSTLGNLTNLVELDIARSGVMLEVPSSVFELRYLEKIYIDRTAMLPMNFRNNSRLNILFK